MLKNILTKKEEKIDYTILGVLILLLILGFGILASASAPLSIKNTGSPYYYLYHQFLLGLIPGVILFFIGLKINIQFLAKIAPLILLINLIMVIATFIPGLGVSSKGATRWLSFGFFSFQPSEFLKLSFIIYLASWIKSKITETKNQRNKIENFIGFLAIIGLISISLILQPHTSTLGIIALTAFIMYFTAKTPIWHNLLIILLGIISLFIIIKLAPYRMERFYTFLNPETDPLGRGYQLKQSLIAIGSGGISGLGLGMSRQKLGFLPESMSDSIFAILSEETGYLGALILLFLFFILLIQGIKIAKKTQDSFLSSCALGITFWISLQTFLNISAMIGLTPLSGIPLPFISYGGSHLIAELAAIGIILNISRHT